MVSIQTDLRKDFQVLLNKYGSETDVGSSQGE